MQTKSKVLPKMAPPAFHTMKRRKLQAMSNNDDEKADVSMSSSGGFRPQSGGSSQTPLSMVRFKEPSSNVFEYHHFVRRVEMGAFTITGATAAEVVYDLDRSALQLISDFAALAAVFNRYRITRIVWNFLPQLTGWPQGTASVTKPLCLSWLNLSSAPSLSLPANFSDALDDCTSVLQDVGRPFTLDYRPMIGASVDEDSDVPASYIIEDARPSPWIPVTNTVIAHRGGSVFGQVALNNGAPANPSQYFTVHVTTYFDMDMIK